MREHVRHENRRFHDGLYIVTFQEPGRPVCSEHVRATDISRGGLCIEVPQGFVAGTPVLVQGDGIPRMGSAVVRHCTQRGMAYRVGIEFGEELKAAISLPKRDDLDFYEVLQISPNAELETIHRVYRIMAARFHPDNPETGDQERFLLLKRAYLTICDPDKRASYDATRQMRDAGPLPIFETKEFVDGVDGEVNRRLGILSILYNRRRQSEDQPGASVLDLERRMAFPREYLNFTIWYLRTKGYIESYGNSDYVLTATGVDYVEANSSSSNILNKLLTGSNGPQEPGQAQTRARLLSA